MTKSIMILALCATTAHAQQSTNASRPVSDATRFWMAQAEKNLVASAQSMPAGKYGFQPTPQQFTFAHLMTHVMETNRYMCSSIARLSLPDSDAVTDHDVKDKIVSHLQASFAKK
jgi:hypothetical protein